MTDLQPDIERGIKCDPQDDAQRSNAPSQQTREEFIEGLSRTAIRDLASRHNGNKPCEIFATDNGSFNVCFFVEFPEDGTRWVVRIPIEPVLQQPWEKLQSEVATINYIRSRTKIPVPRIHAFGNGEILTKTTTTRQMFIISDYIHGQNLKSDVLLRAESSTRSRLCQDIFNILLQLRELEFGMIGSLMPGKSEEEPIVSNLLTFSANEIPGARLPTFTTAREFMLSQFDVLLQHSALPADGFTESDIRFELFAIHSLQNKFAAVIPDELNHGPFVLHHPDLRLGNIIVDEDLKIQGVIDWEFTHTVPLALFAPPSWAAGHDPGLEHLSTLFLLELRDAAANNEPLEQLRREWYMSNPDARHIAHIVRYPGDVSTVFDKFFATILFGDDVDKAESDFFEADVALDTEARRRAARLCPLFSPP